MLFHNGRSMHSYLAAAAALAALTLPALCQAQAWPNKPIRFITQNTPGAPADLYYRLIADGISPMLGQPIIMENRPGAGGMLAVDATSKAAPDGYTLGMGGSGPLAVTPLLQKTPYDPLKSFTHISMAFEAIQVLGVSTGSKINSIPELIGFARANPGKLNYATNGPGSTSHLAMEWLKMKEGIDIVHVAYKSQADFEQAFRVNAVQVAIYGGQTFAVLEKAGAVKMLAALGTSREPGVPHVPTVIEVGYTGFLVTAWGSVIAPAGVPRDVVERVNRSLREHLTKPDVVAKAVQISRYTPMVTTPEETVAILNGLISRWKDVIDRAKIKIE